MKKIFLFAAAVLSAVTMRAQVEKVFDWYEEVGSYSLVAVGTAGAVSETTVNIHANTDQVDCIKFTKGVTTDDFYMSFQPASGTFLTGDVVHIKGVTSVAPDSETGIVDASKIAQVQLQNASGTGLVTSGDLINAFVESGEPTELVYQLTADAALLRIGRKGKTNIFITEVIVNRGESVTPPPVDPVDPTDAVLATDGGVWDFSDWADMSGTGVLDTVIHHLGLYAGTTTVDGAPTVNANFAAIESSSNTFSDGTKTSKVLKLNGGMGEAVVAMPTKRYLYFGVQGPTTIQVWFKSGKSGDSRTMYVTDGTNILGSLADAGSKAILTATYTANVPATLYVFASNNCVIGKLSATSGVTALENAEAAAPKAVKRMIDGQVVIEKGGKYYNLLGAEIEL